MDRKELKKIVALKDQNKIQEEIEKQGWLIAKDTGYAGQVGLVELFNANEICCSPKVKKDDKYYQIAIFDDVEGGKKWVWLVFCVEKKYGLGKLPSALKIYVKEK